MKYYLSILFALSYFYIIAQPPSKTNISSSTSTNSSIRPDSVILCQENIAGACNFEQKNIYTYDTNDHLTQEVIWEWDNTNSQWVRDEKYDFLYNSNGDETQEIESVWNSGLNQWVNVRRTNSTYNNGNKIEMIISNWDGATNQWRNNTKEDYTYNSNNDRTQSISYTWDDTMSLWNNSYKHTYSYNANGNRLSFISMMWNISTNQWQNQGKFEYTSYDTNGNNTQFISSEWQVSTWVVQGKTDYTYNANDQITARSGYTWDPINSQWLKGYGVDYIYDNNGNKIEEYGYTAANNQWVPSVGFVFTYDSNNGLASRTNYTWQSSSSTWKFSIGWQYTNYYSSTISIRHLQQVENLARVFPNPVQKKMYVNIQEGNNELLSFSLMNLQGKRIFLKELKSNQSIDIHSLSAGVYFYTIKNASQIQTGKIIKQ